MNKRLERKTTKIMKRSPGYAGFLQWEKPLCSSLFPFSFSFLSTPVGGGKQNSPGRGKKKKTYMIETNLKKNESFFLSKFTLNIYFLRFNRFKTSMLLVAFKDVSIANSVQSTVDV